MAEYCKCGSLVFNSKCTNKNCENKAPKVKPAVSAKKKKEATDASKPAVRVTRRSSKCVTYKLSDFLDKETTPEDSEYSREERTVEKEDYAEESEEDE